MPDISLELIHPNPFRDFDLHPIDAAHVEKLKRSIGTDGFWASVVARPVGDRYELAFGHHRIEAARQLGMRKVPIEVRQDLTDWQMVRMLSVENATQRGSAPAACLDAVQAIVKVLAYHLLRWKDEATFFRNLEKVAIDFQSCRGRLIAGRGLGRDCIMAVTRENYTTYQIDNALAVMRQSGIMVHIIEGAQIRVQAELATEEEAAAEAVRIAGRNAGAATTRRERTAASKAMHAAEITEQDINETVKTASQAVLSATQRMPVVYDARCDHLFKNDAHADVFRNVVTGETFRSFLPLTGQFDFAKSVLAVLRENAPNKEITGRDIRTECWARIETGLGISKGKLRTAPERPYLEEIKEGLNLLRRAEGDFKRGVALLIRGFQLGERLDAKQAERLSATEATFAAGWDGMKAYRQPKQNLKLVKGD